MIRCAPEPASRMKVCSICHRHYADSLKFCLDDGTVLTHAPELDATLVDPPATLRLNARETDARPVAPNHTKPLPWIAIATVSIVVVIAVVAIAAVLLINSANKSSESSSATNSPASQSSPISPLSNAEQVLLANDAVGEALLQGDTDDLSRLLADEYRYVSDLGVTFNKPEILTLIRTGNLSYTVLTTADPKVEVAAGFEKAEVNGTAKAKGQLRRQPFTDSYFYRNSYQKRDGRWQLVSGTVWHRQ